MHAPPDSPLVPMTAAPVTTGRTLVSALLHASRAALIAAALCSSVLMLPVMSLCLSQLEGIRHDQARALRVIASRARAAAPSPVIIERCSGDPTPEPAVSKCLLAPLATLVGRDHREVRRAAIDCVLSNTSALSASRILPVARGGRIVGVRIVALHPDDVPARLGLRVGDVITHVNGFDVASPDHALEAYSRLRSASTVTVRIERGGRARLLRYDIIEG